MCTGDEIFTPLLSSSSELQKKARRRRRKRRASVRCSAGMAQKSARRHSFHLFISFNDKQKSALKRCEGRFHIVNRKESSPRYLIILFVIKFNTISILYIYLIVDLIRERKRERKRAFIKDVQERIEPRGAVRDQAATRTTTTTTTTEFFERKFETTTTQLIFDNASVVDGDDDCEQ